MADPLSGIAIIICIAFGVLLSLSCRYEWCISTKDYCTFVLLFIFANRQIKRFSLKSKSGPHIPVAQDAPKFFECGDFCICITTSFFRHRSTVSLALYKQLQVLEKQAQALERQTRWLLNFGLLWSPFMYQPDIIDPQDFEGSSLIPITWLSGLKVPE
ncbi:UNVERIFIED_CONTAM: hypothetical protein NCL1_43513 [Trichonephila clavipes]